ncbi:MAG: hypothetical protein HY040_05645 [Planctomycetes bacterium]|nr:hypothetical protein [Planctomycetota bacterium]
MRCVIVAIVVCAFFECGCNKEPEPTPKGPVPVAQGKDQAPKEREVPPRQPKLTRIGRRMEISEVRNIMQQLGLAYVQYETQFKKGPKTISDLESYLEKNPKFTDPLKNGHITFVFNVSTMQMPSGPGNSILAYENDVDVNGFRVVLMGNGQTVQDLNEEDFNKSPKAGK